MPGAGFKRDAAKVKISVEEAHVKPYDMVRRTMVSVDIIYYRAVTEGEFEYIGNWSG